MGGKGKGLGDSAVTAVGVAGQLLLQVCVRVQPWPTLCDPMDCSPQAPLSMGFPGKNN